MKYPCKVCLECKGYSKGKKHWPRKWFCTKLHTYFINTEYLHGRTLFFKDDPCLMYGLQKLYYNNDLEIYNRYFNGCIKFKELVEYSVVIEDLLEL